MSHGKRPFLLAGEVLDADTGTIVVYEARAVTLGGGLIQISGWCGLSHVDIAEFSFVYVPETHDAIVYSQYKLEYINSEASRAVFCRNTVFSNPYYFEDIGEMSAMAPCIRTSVSRGTIFLRPLIKMILGDNPLHQLTLPIERFAHYHRR
jgi:hypothetical protein